MGAMTVLPAATEGWTVDDLDAFPDDGLRYELVDGSLHVSPPATVRHSHAASHLGYLFSAALDVSWVAVVDAGIRFDDRTYRQPDLSVVSRQALDRPLAVPADVLLAVEVVSPNSVTADRLTKPAQYARAGIVHYWRLEPSEPLLVTFELDGETYREAGRFTDEVVVERPVPLRFRLAVLLS